MPTGLTSLLHILYCFAPEDRHWPFEIDRHLKQLRNQCQLVSWFDGELVSQADEKKKFMALFRRTDIIVVLVSQHFQPVASFWEELAREKNRLFSWPGLCRVMIIVLEEVGWHEAPYGAQDILPRTIPLAFDWLHPESFHLQQPFPDDLLPLTAWPERKQAFQAIEQGMRAAIEQHWLIWGDYCMTEGIGVQRKQALIAYNEALRLNPAIGPAWYGKAHMLVEFKRYEEALDACDAASQLAPTFPWPWFVKGNALANLHREEEALEAYHEAFKLEPKNTHFRQRYMETLKALGKENELQ